ncbi:PAS/PAC sensor signal transduction histidine kinase [Halorubrum aidingense JCM 13560]|uniref:histidine kinase n=1 Tax=Halorubrum aidingense JCM 13560 TaxID=1230454 RepID=M0PAX4_9EURY|nr:PAS domain-containing sensor histidine kinase [Halorubrum aidingense]EMA65975.1 PAS/PAC sensor signal transduction histidine kinase [Halorubrum aidingense JCM 13560]
MQRDVNQDPWYAESIVSALGDGAYVLDADRNRVFVNDRLREVTAFGDDVLHGKHPERVVAEGYWSEEMGDRYRAAVERVLAGESTDERVQLTTTLGDGSTVTTETRLTPLTGDENAPVAGGDASSGDVIGVVGVIRDVTDRVERERELERLNQRLERLAGFLSHDLRNPVSIAQGYLELARETDDIDRLDPADDALDRIESLIDDALVMARDPESIETDAAPVDVGDLATDCWESGDFGEPAADARLVVEGGATVRADPSLLRRAIGNLIGNAVEHAGESPTVRVGVDDEGIYVGDDGPGIPADEREAVAGFGVSNDGGTGIGLAIVERAAAAHGWSLELGESPSGGAEARLVGAEPTG